MDKRVLITGAAGGIGSAIARAYAAQGAQVLLGYNSNRDKAQALCDDLPGTGHLVRQIPVLDSPALQSLAQALRTEWGHLDILINNAGMTKMVPHADLDALEDRDIDQIMATNFRGPFACIRAFRPLLESSGDGLIINISSLAGTTAVGSCVAYCASKSALNNMTMSLARALAPKIRVVALAPGWVAGEYASKADPAYLQEQVDKTPLKRIATATDVAKAALALSQAMTFSTGCIIPVDGGRPLN
ncbi:MAG: SDR family oxidoreductase [Cellvibrionales bacterium]|nr:SDR family oxidoreductase [Cellvibrionales bacterium]